MMDAGERRLSTTWSVCPHCLARLPAERVARGDGVYLRKCCPEHGTFETIVWRGLPDPSEWAGSSVEPPDGLPATGGEKGCPYDCDSCVGHARPTCCALLEVTQRCDLECRICFADAGQGRGADPPLSLLAERCRALSVDGVAANLQLSGGEPTTRDDLPEIVAMARSLGFQFIQLNSNGRRISRDRPFLEGLREAGLSCVFLQFDGTEDEIYRRIRGADLLAEKLAAIEACRDCDLGVVLVPTLVPGVNTHDIGAIVRFALQQLPAVRGVHFQPVSYFGRYPKPPSDGDRITLPEVMQAIVEQSGGMIPAESFKPGNSEHPWCSFHANFALMPDGRLLPLTTRESRRSGDEVRRPALEAAREFVARQWSAPSPEPRRGCCGGPDLSSWDDLLERLRSHSFCLSGMAFQDAWTLDLERLRSCHVHVLADRNRVVPFCAYNLTDLRGRALYRAKGVASSSSGSTGT
jgi:7,8-dihydro-6-hydroxymethylpterin dimethyltransferase